MKHKIHTILALLFINLGLNGQNNFELVIAGGLNYDLSLITLNGISNTNNTVNKNTQIGTNFRLGTMFQLNKTTKLGMSFIYQKTQLILKQDLITTEDVNFIIKNPNTPFPTSFASFDYSLNRLGINLMLSRPISSTLSYNFGLTFYPNLNKGKVPNTIFYGSANRTEINSINLFLKNPQVGGEFALLYNLKSLGLPKTNLYLSAEVFLIREGNLLFDGRVRRFLVGTGFFQFI